MKLLPFALVTLIAAADAAELPAAAAAELEKRFFAAQRATRTLAADFTQTLTAPGLPAPVVSRGQILFRAPDDLRIVYTEPAGEVLQLDATSFTALRTGRPPVRRPPGHASARALSSLRDILRGQRPEGEMAATVTRRGHDYLVVLTPAATGGFQPERIENIIDARSMQLRSMSITLPRGTLLRFDFAKPRRNQPLPPDAFSTV
jgi:outer membrane lipoprotein-sorting protein